MSGERRVLECATGVFEGPAQVCRYANEVLVEWSGFDPTGMPAREAFPDNDAVQEAMMQALQTGRSVTHHAPDGVVRIRPLRFEGRVWAVATCWTPAHAPVDPAPLPGASQPTGSVGLR